MLSFTGSGYRFRANGQTADWSRGKSRIYSALIVSSVARGAILHSTIDQQASTIAPILSPAAAAARGARTRADARLFTGAHVESKRFNHARLIGLLERNTSIIDHKSFMRAMTM
jgi:hypothetical protein